EREPADAPEHAEEERPEERLRVGGLEDGDRARQDREREGPRRDDPREDAAHHPEDLPGPAADALVGQVEAGGGEAADRVEPDAQRGVRIHQQTRATSMSRRRPSLSIFEATCPTPTAQWCAGPYRLHSLTYARAPTGKRYRLFVFPISSTGPATDS